MSEWTGVAGKRVLITGATRGIGLAAARELASRGAMVAIVARSDERGRAALEAIGDVAGAQARPELLIAELSSMRSVHALAQEALRRYPRIDLLVNNAGAIFASRQMTEEGVERTWALNHLAPFLLSDLLLSRMRESAPARVITTSSDAHKGMRIPFDDISGERSYGAFGFKRYGQSKLANILFTAELARRAKDTGVGAYCFHPGVVASGFNRNNGPLASLAMTAIRPFSRSPEQGAQTLLWLAESADPGPSGAYYAERRPASPSGAGRDMDAAARLWQASEEQVAAALHAAGVR